MIANNDPRFLFSKWPDESHNEQPAIQSKRVSQLTKLMFVPEAICHADTSNNDCYVGIPLDTPGKFSIPNYFPYYWNYYYHFCIITFRWSMVCVWIKIATEFG